MSFLVRRYFDQSVFGRLYGIAFGLYILGTGFGPILLGASFDRFGGYQPGLLLFTGLSLIAVVMAVAMPRYQSPSKRLNIPGGSKITSV